mmetsp:Transcript_53183/g.119905  ORF Transcript_53183/g.119905 Transcript_53183/m.119905 type:complete len:131 (-) Transcript_53183:1319-1711(-)
MGRCISAVASAAPADALGMRATVFSPNLGIDGISGSAGFAGIVCYKGVTSRTNAISSLCAHGWSSPRRYGIPQAWLGSCIPASGDAGGAVEAVCLAARILAACKVNNIGRSAGGCVKEAVGTEALDNAGA